MPRLIALLLSIIAFEVFSQTQTTDRTAAILGLVNYRDELIGSETISELEALDSLWKGPDKEYSTHFMFRVVHIHELLGVSTEKMLAQAQGEIMDTWLQSLYTEETIETIVKNKDLIDLLNSDVLLPDPPFQIDSKTTFFKELEVYKIQNGMTVAEIGAGNGTFSLLLGLVYDSLHIFVNDLRETAVFYASAKTYRCKSKKTSNKFDFVFGKKKSTGLPKAAVDKVIIRNSFHHFSHKKQMLASIKQSLKSGGSLYIFDPIILPDEKPSCDKTLALKQLKKEIAKGGFEIVEELSLEPYTWKLLHCKAKG